MMSSQPTPLLLENTFLNLRIDLLRHKIQSYYVRPAAHLLLDNFITLLYCTNYFGNIPDSFIRNELLALWVYFGINTWTLCVFLPFGYHTIIVHDIVIWPLFAWPFFAWPFFAWPFFCPALWPKWSYFYPTLWVKNTFLTHNWTNETNKNFKMNDNSSKESTKFKKATKLY